MLQICVAAVVQHLDAELRERYEQLTPKKREVMRLGVQGLLNKQIALTLNNSEITIKQHRGKVMRKMRAETLVDSRTHDRTSE